MSNTNKLSTLAVQTNRSIAEKSQPVLDINQYLKGSIDIAELFGKMPGEETDEEVFTALVDLS